MADIGTIEILGQEITVSAHTTGAFFLRDEEGQSLGSGDTLDKAKAKARTELSKRRVEVAVPFRLDDGRRGVAKRRHARNRTIIVEIEGMRDEIEGMRRSGTLLPNTPDDQINRLKAEREAERAAHRQAEAIEKEWRLDLGDAVDTAVEAALAEKGRATDGG